MQDGNLIFIVAVVMFFVGVGYAYIISTKMWKPKRTWVSVVVGDGLTDVGSFLVLYVLTGNVWVALVPVFAHLLMGIPMIVGQVVKHRRQS